MAGQAKRPLTWRSELLPKVRRRKIGDLVVVTPRTLEHAPCGDFTRSGFIVACGECAADLTVVAGERKKDLAVWDRRRPARKGEKSELTRTQQADRQILGTDDDGFAHGSFARFFNSANARPARRPSLVAVELSSLAWSVRPSSKAVNQRRKRAS